MLNYYRNNIVHLFVLPSLIFHGITNLEEQKLVINVESIVNVCDLPYQQLQKALFLSDRKSATDVLSLTISKMLKIKWLSEVSGEYNVSDNELSRLMKGHVDDPFNKNSAEI